jgi:hypothetical protein
MSAEYNLFRLADVPDADELPPGRYVLTREGRKARMELELFEATDRASLADAIGRILEPWLLR